MAVAVRSRPRMIVDQILHHWSGFLCEGAYCAPICIALLDWEKSSKSLQRPHSPSPRLPWTEAIAAAITEFQDGCRSWWHVEVLFEYASTYCI